MKVYGRVTLQELGPDWSPIKGREPRKINWTPWGYGGDLPLDYPCWYSALLENGTEFPLWPGLFSWVGASDRVNLTHNVSWVRFPDPASYVDWICWFSTLLREVFSPGTPVFPSPQKWMFNLIWFHLFDLFIWFDLFGLQSPQLVRVRVLQRLET